MYTYLFKVDFFVLLHSVSRLSRNKKLVYVGIDRMRNKLFYRGGKMEYLVDGPSSLGRAMPVSPEDALNRHTNGNGL